MYVRGYLQGSENGRVVTIANLDPEFSVLTLISNLCHSLCAENTWQYPFTTGPKLDIPTLI